MKQIYTTLLVFLALLTTFSCGQKKQPNRTAFSELSFNPLVGTRFIEVRREFDSGYAFNNMGFEQKPEWDIYFLPGDSVKIYSPFERRYIGYPIYFDHDSVFNTAREWFRLKSASRDSMVLQLLQVKNKIILRDQSNIYMKFYAKQYLDKIHADAARLKLPQRKDSLYIQKLCARANRYPDNIDSAFAATSPVAFSSIHPDIKATRIEPKKGLLDDFKASDVYMHPVYDITINHAYKDFFYSFAALVDDRGMIRFGELLTVVEDKENRKAVLRGIIQVYLQRMLKITPGRTLGYPHTSLITLNVKGIASDN